MPRINSDVDAYIAKSADFAQPILKKIRQLYHKADKRIEETIKWGVPNFEYEGLVGMMAAFKNHVSFGFWKQKLMKDPHKIFTGKGSQLAARQIESVEDLPPDKVIMEYVREAIALNEQKVKRPTVKTKSGTKKVTIPDYFIAALKKNKRALATFEGFNYSNKRDYVEWLTEAKQETTLQKRLKTAIEWLADGKPRNWKYMKKW